MTANNTQQEIIKAFSQDRKIPQFTILELLYKCNINFIDQSTVEGTIKRLQKENDETIIPQPIKTDTTLTKGKENPITREVKYKYETREIYQDEKRVKELKKKINDNKAHIKFLKDLLVYTKPPFAQQNEPQAGTSKKSKSNKPKKDTTSKKNDFIDLFIDKCFDNVYSEGDQKKIAGQTGVSQGTVSRYFKNLDLLESLLKKMKTIYSNNNDDGNFTANYYFIINRIKKLKDKKNVRDYLESKKQEKQLNRDIKSGSKFESFDEFAETKLNKNHSNEYNIDNIDHYEDTDQSE